MTKPIYLQIYEDIKQSIQTRQYKPGDRIPSEKEVAAQWNVSIITPRKALTMLQDEGLIIRQAGRGSFVKEKPVLRKQSEPKQPMIGVVFTDFNDSFGRGLLNGIEQAVEGRANFLFRRSFGEPEKEEQLIKDFLELGVDGFIILPAHATHLNNAILQLVLDEFPLVLIDRYLKGVGATAIGTDNIKAAKEGTTHLFHAGHRNLLVLSPPASYAVVIEERINGIKQAFQRYNKSTKSLIIDNEITSTLPDALNAENVAQDVKRIKTQLENNPAITAVFAIEYNIALLVRLAMKELGLHCPGDISIICFDSPPHHIGDFSFTHLLQDQERIGTLAVENILEILTTENKKQITLLDAILVEGESVNYINNVDN